MNVELEDHELSALRMLVGKQITALKRDKAKYRVKFFTDILTKLGGNTYGINKKTLQ
jgi:hypothetical protein